MIDISAPDRPSTLTEAPLLPISNWRQASQSKLMGGDEPVAIPPAGGPSRFRNSKYAIMSMIMLVLQGTALSITLRFSRVKVGTPYLASVSVFFTEAIKLALCCIIEYRKRKEDALENKEPIGRAMRQHIHEIVNKSLPMALPAGMFVGQQVLLIIAATHLDAVAFQIFSQSFKLVPTALFAYWLLGQHLEAVQWCSIPVLAFGVVLVTINNSHHAVVRSAAATAAAQHSGPLGYFAGMVACSVSGLSSAYAGVYFEKYVKGKHAASLWVRNIQLGIYGVPASLLYAVIKDFRKIHAPLQGFDSLTWATIALQVFGGLVTGMVVKFCDNILKNFALAVSVILTVLLAVPLFGQWPSTFFLMGVGLVLLSVFMYSEVVLQGPSKKVLKQLESYKKKYFFHGRDSG